LGYWGFQSQDNTLLKILLGIGLPLIAAVIWGLFVSPKAQYRLPEIGRLALEIAVFGSAVLALNAAGKTTLSLIMAILVIIHLPLTFLLHQRQQ
jgi:uncharacterized membrane protein